MKYTDTVLSFLKQIIIVNSDDSADFPKITFYTHICLRKLCHRQGWTLDMKNKLASVILTNGPRLTELRTFKNLLNWAALRLRTRDLSFRGR